MHIIENGQGGVVGREDSMYPSRLTVLESQGADFSGETVYGYVVSGILKCGNDDIKAGRFFSLPVKYSETLHLFAIGRTVLFSRKGFLGQEVVGMVEKEGRVSYIDGCTDSVLVLPPRLGDACLNSLHFPKGILQTFHTHPSIRLGVVAAGSGKAWVKKHANAEPEVLPLKQGDAFCLDTNRIHRFSTDDKEMVIVAYHPDSDWGPTDTVHPMINRTYIGK